MSLLGSPDLHKLIDDGVIDAPHSAVNSSSIDVRIGDRVLMEGAANGVVDISAKESPNFNEVMIPEEGLVIKPGECFLAHTVETFNLPDNISCDFMLRSTVGRCFLEHMHAGHADGGWHGSQLTMEFKNVLQHHSLLIKPGMRIGQMEFFKHSSSEEDSYATKGSYNNQQGPTKAFGGTNHADML